MVGVLIVSHSKEVAEGAKKLAEEMIQAQISLEAIGGTGDGRLGTNADLIYQALDRLKSEDGVIVIVDMGSSVMNVELAFELFSEDIRDKFRIANVPIVEGAITTAIEASGGRDLDEIIEFVEAEDFSQKVFD